METSRYDTIVSEIRVRLLDLSKLTKLYNETKGIRERMRLYSEIQDAQNEILRLIYFLRNRFGMR